MTEEEKFNNYFKDCPDFKDMDEKRQARHMSKIVEMTLLNYQNLELPEHIVYLIARTVFQEIEKAMSEHVRKESEEAILYAESCVK